MAGVVVCNPPGSKVGNSTMSWLFAYAHSLRVGAEFQCGPWVGEKVFNLPAYSRPDGKPRPHRSSMDLGANETDVEIRCYAQNQAAMIYTRKQAREWLKPIHNEADLLKYFHLGPHQLVAAHVRRGDYVGYGYPLISLSSYERAIKDHKLNAHLTGLFGYDFEKYMIVSDLCPQLANGWIAGIGDIQFIVDFTILRTSAVLLRANSSFSWVAALLNTHRVFSPVVKGLEGGREHDVEFVEGNHSALSDLACGSDMHLPE